MRRASPFWACVLHASMNSSSPFALVDVPEDVLPSLVPSGAATYWLLAIVLVATFGARDPTPTACAEPARRG